MYSKTLTGRIVLRGMSRSNLSPEFAPSDRINAHRKLAEDFTRRVLGLERAWISDESSLWDFHTETTNDAMFAKIKEIYGVDVSDVSSGRLYEIFERIAAHGI
jgi:hypothetical protein